MPTHQITHTFQDQETPTWTAAEAAQGQATNTEALIDFAICWEQGGHDHIDFIQVPSLQAALDRLQAIKDTGCVHHVKDHEHFEDGYYIGFDQWRVAHVGDLDPQSRNPNKYTQFGRLCATYTNKSTAAAHLDAIRLRGRLLFVHISQYSMLQQERNTLREQNGKLQEHIDNLDEHIKELVAEIAELKKRKRPARKKS